MNASNLQQAENTACHGWVSNLRKNVKTNIGQRFLQLIDKHLPPSNKLHKIFDRHNVRISYSCLDNMNSFINRQQENTKKTHETNERKQHRRHATVELQTTRQMPGRTAGFTASNSE